LRFLKRLSKPLTKTNEKNQLSFVMKRNISVFVLTFEIAAIVVLHAVKMNQPQQVQGIEQSANNISKLKVAEPVVKHYPLLSIK
jgi:hypothetical protein